jgi:hypothetical protein
LQDWGTGTVQSYASDTLDPSLGDEILLKLDHPTAGSTTINASYQYWHNGSPVGNFVSIGSTNNGFKYQAGVQPLFFAAVQVGPTAPAAPSTPLPPPPTTQTVFTVPTGQLPTAAVSTTATGTYGNATVVVTLDLAKALAGGSFAGLGQFASGYNIYVVALVPSAVLGSGFALVATRGWTTLSFPIAAYMTGLAQNATDKIIISILSGLDVTGLVGAEIYIGYGLSDTEMLAAQRYRGVYKVQ